MAGERDAGLDAGHAACVEFASRVAGRRARIGSGPRRCPSARRGARAGPVRLIAVAAADGRGLVAGGRQAGRGVQVLRGREALDREAVGGERGGANDRRRRASVVRIWPGAGGQQPLELVVDEGDVLAQRPEARDVARQPLRRAARRRRAAPDSPSNAPPRTPRSRRSGARRRAPAATAALGARPSNAIAQANTARPVGVSSNSARPCPAGRREARRERVELVVQALPQRLEREHELAAMRDRRRASPRPASSTAGRPAPWRASQTSAAQSRSSVLNRRAPICARAACVSDGANTRNAPGQRRSSSLANARCNDPVASTANTGSTATDQPDELLDPSPRVRDRHRLTDQPAFAIGQPHPMRDLARIDRHHQTDRPRALSTTPAPDTSTNREEREKAHPQTESRPQLNPIPRDLSALRRRRLRRRATASAAVPPADGRDARRRSGGTARRSASAPAPIRRRKRNPCHSRRRAASG